MHPAGLPDLFLDRSLGRKQLPERLRARGLRLTTLAEHYGVPADEDIEDVEWLELVGTRGWAALMKDAEVRRRPSEKRAIIAHRVRAFCLSGGNLTAEQMSERYLRALSAMTRACVYDDGPSIYAVHADRIVRLDLA